MKIYFFANSGSGLKDGERTNNIIDVLQKAGVLVLSNLEQDNVFEFSQYDREKTTQGGGLFLERVDGLVIDSGASVQESAYLIALALTYKKPILYLLEKGGRVNEQLEGLIKDKEIAKLLKVDYFTKTNLNKKVLDFLSVIENKDGRERPNIKFTLRITPRIERYLHWRTHNTKLSKADFLREMIDNIIDQDDKYKRQQ